MESIGKSFKKQTMEKIISNKLNHWIDNYTNIDEEKDQLRSSIILTGGAITSMLLGEMPNDYDIYFSNKEVAAKVATHYISKMTKTHYISRIKVEETDIGVSVFIKSAGVLDVDGPDSEYQYFEMLPPSELEEFFDKYIGKKYNLYDPMNITSNSIYLNGDINIILRFCGNHETIHENFDFEHCKNYFTFETGVVLLDKAVLSTITKELIYSGSRFPICSLFRLRKFIKRGFTITAGQIFKIAWDISKLDLNDIDTLRLQITGVDASYFSEILSILKENSEKNLDRTYLFNLVDRVFHNDDD